MSPACWSAGARGNVSGWSAATALLIRSFRSLSPPGLWSRDMLRQPLEWRKMAPGADLRAILNYERDQRIAAAWACDDIGSVCSFFFAVREGVRIQVGIECHDPAGSGPIGQSDSTHR